MNDTTLSEFKQAALTMTTPNTLVPLNINELVVFDALKTIQLTQANTKHIITLLQTNDSTDLNLLMRHLLNAELIDAACTLIIAAYCIDNPVDAYWLTGILPIVDDITIIMPLIRSINGDNDLTLVQLVEADILSSERESLILYFLARKHQNNPPASLITALRRSTRRAYSFVAQIQIGLAAKLVDNDDLNQVATQQINLVNLHKPVEAGLLSLFELPILELLPIQATSNRVQGKTLRRKTEKIHRNDPCPCGSGKKFKKCCLSKTNACENEWETDPDKTMTWQQFHDLRPHEMAVLVLAELSTEYLRIAINKFISFNRWDDASRAINLLAERDSDLEVINSDDYRIDLIYQAIKSGHLDIAKQQKTLIKGTLDPEINIKFELADPSADCLSQLNDFALESLKTKNHFLIIELAHSMLNFYPALGIFIARGVFHKNHFYDNEALLQSIEEARDILGLSPNDYAQNLMDMLLDQGIYSEITSQKKAQKHSLSKNTHSELLEFQEKYQSAQQQITALEKNLQIQEQTLRNMSADEQLEKPTPISPVTEVDKEKELALRKKIKELKSLIKTGNNERSQLRSQLNNLQNSTDDSSQESQKNQEITSEIAESLEVDISQQQLEIINPNQQKMAMIPVFDEKARKHLQEVPIKIAQLAIQSSTSLSTELPINWQNVKQLKSSKATYSARLGIHYRMFFLVDTDKNELMVTDIIHRSKLESTLKK